MKMTLVIFGVLAAIILLSGWAIYLIGRTQPERHTLKISFWVEKPWAAVWAAITDYGSMPQWRRR